MALKSKNLAAPSTAGVANAVMEMVVDAAVLRMPLSQIDVQAQVRTEFPPEELASLAADMKKNGQLQPAIVRTHPDKRNRYILVMGGRRYKACQINGEDLRVVVIDDMEDLDRIEDAQWSENHERAALSLKDQAAVFRRDLARLGTQAAVAVHRNVSESTVSSLLSVSEAAQDPKSHVSKAMRVGMTNVDDLSTVNKVAKRSPEAAENLIKKVAAGTKNLRAESRAALRTLNEETGKRTGETVAAEIHVIMGVGSNGRERTAVDDLPAADLDMLKHYLRPLFIDGAECEAVNATRALHRAVFAKPASVAQQRWMTAAFMAGLLSDGAPFDLGAVVTQASYDDLV